MCSFTECWELEETRYVMTYDTGVGGVVHNVLEYGLSLCVRVVTWLQASISERSRGVVRWIEVRCDVILWCGCLC